MEVLEYDIQYNYRLCHLYVSAQLERIHCHKHQQLSQVLFMT